MPEFYIIIARKNFFPNFRGTRAPLPPSPAVSYAYGRHINYSTPPIDAYLVKEQLC